MPPVELRAGEAISVDALFREHAGFVAKFLVRMGAPPREIEDLVQDVFVVAHRRGGYSPGPALPRTWLAEIARRVHSSARRARRRRPTCALDDVPAPRSGAPRPDEVVALRQALHRLAHGLSQIDEGDRGALMCAIEGVPHPIAAGRLGIPVGTLYSRVFRARRLLRAVWPEVVE